MICVTMSSIIFIEWPDKSEIYQEWLQLALGFGLMMGPVSSAFFVHWFKYQGTIFFFTCLIAVVGLATVVCLPARLNYPDTPEEKTADKEEIPFSIFFKVPRSLVCLIAFMLSMVCFFYFDPSLSLALTNHGMTDANSGLGFALIALTYVGCLPIAGLLS